MHVHVGEDQMLTFRALAWGDVPFCTLLHSDDVTLTQWKRESNMLYEVHLCLSFVRKFATSVL